MLQYRITYLEFIITINTSSFKLPQVYCININCDILSETVITWYMLVRNALSKYVLSISAVSLYSVSLRLMLVCEWISSFLSSQSFRLQKDEGQTCGLSFFLVICSHLIVFHPHFSCSSSRPAASWPLAMSRPARLPTLIFRRSGAAVWKEAQHLQFTKIYKTFN